jgi:hypothetical protein
LTGEAISFNPLGVIQTISADSKTRITLTYLSEQKIHRDPFAPMAVIRTKSSLLHRVMTQHGISWNVRKATTQTILPLKREPRVAPTRKESQRK